MNKSRIFAVLLVVAVIAVVIFVLMPRRTLPSHAVNGQPQRGSDLSSNAAAETNTTEVLTRSTKAKQRPLDALATGRLDEIFNPSDYQYRSVVAVKTPSVAGALAYIQIPSSNRRVSLSPNSIGEYESMPVLTGETVGVRVRIEDVSPGTPVSLVILDGGSFSDGSGPSKIIKLGGDSQIFFRFTTSSNVGYHRVRVLPSGGSARIFDFNASKS